METVVLGKGKGSRRSMAVYRVAYFYIAAHRGIGTVGHQRIQKCFLGFFCRHDNRLARKPFITPNWAVGIAGTGGGNVKATIQRKGINIFIYQITAAVGTVADFHIFHHLAQAGAAVLIKLVVATTGGSETYATRVCQSADYVGALGIPI